MFRIILICCAAFLVLAGCDEAPTRSSDTNGWDIVCIEGHQYIQQRGGYGGGLMAPKFNSDDKPAKCNEAEGWKK